MYKGAKIQWPEIRQVVSGHLLRRSPGASEAGIEDTLGYIYWFILVWIEKVAPGGYGRGGTGKLFLQSIVIAAAGHASSDNSVHRQWQAWAGHQGYLHKHRYSRSSKDHSVP